MNENKIRVNPLNPCLKKNIMLRDDEQVISTEPMLPPTPPTPGLVDKLEAQGFRPFTDEW